jgi:type III pantothenate kinase
MVVGPGVKTGFPIKTDNPSELGADLVANAASVVLDKEQKLPAIIIDMNAASTIFAINKKGEYIGGCIFPGIKTSFDSLRDGTALLPNVAISVPDKAIGKNSGDCVRSGVVLGHALMIDGFIDRFEKEMGCVGGEAKLFATGEYAELLVDILKRKVEYVEDLTLNGLLRIYQKNQ